MHKKTFIINYTLKNKSGQIIKDGKMRVKNKISKFEAQCSFEEYLKKKHKDFGYLEIHQCYEDIFSFLGFEGNPFGF